MQASSPTRAWSQILMLKIAQSKTQKIEADDYKVSDADDNTETDANTNWQQNASLFHGTVYLSLLRGCVCFLQDKYCTVHMKYGNNYFAKLTQQQYNTVI